ncbi:Fe(3+) ABC transporter substrate-binding protein [Desertibacillus haloalkaliphilus]|uniref:Fe(3+) ABC transporter substrate-binding protein n=1 Tax=Desertibacillus haloalkaliphilus TaxID=1328930 RepID=UPI001C275B2A|nr:Fe(3+) ABC transporter substrate-binding protein [Desertibacillus haloalkaliphilus]MBU8908773.1 Fe(3+) ABC transporter substrate-binding protein [Desertibacillus haloalkaliphilus]
MKRSFKLLFFAMLVLLTVIAAGCGSSEETDAGAGQQDSPDDTTAEEQASQDEDEGVVNLYTSRHYDTDRELYDVFEEQTGIKVNVIEGKGDELIERMNIEGEETEADVFITADAGNLHVAKENGLLQSVESDVLFENIPEKLRDVDNEWFGITKRARVIVYDKDRVDPSELSTYEALTEPEWEDRVLIRSSENMYNKSLLASFIELNGEEAAEEWAAGIVNNMARDPQGGDRDQAKGVAAGEADVAIMNTYYIGRMLNSEDANEVEVAESVGIFFPNQETNGTHINISGAAVTQHAPNADNAVKFIEFLSSEDAQGKFASANFEYPANPNVEPAELLQSWGEFEEQDIDLSVLGQNQQEAMRIFDRAGWK